MRLPKRPWGAPPPARHPSPATARTARLSMPAGTTGPSGTVKVMAHQLLLQTAVPTASTLHPACWAGVAGCSQPCSAPTLCTLAPPAGRGWETCLFPLPGLPAFLCSGAPCPSALHILTRMGPELQYTAVPAGSSGLGREGLQCREADAVP